MYKVGHTVTKAIMKFLLTVTVTVNKNFITAFFILANSTTYILCKEVTQKQDVTNWIDFPIQTIY